MAGADDMQPQALLEEARQAGRRRGRWVSGGLFSAGCLLFFPGLLYATSTYSSMEPNDSSLFVAAFTVDPGAFIAALSLTPVHERTTRGAILSIAVAGAILSTATTTYSVLIAITNDDSYCLLNAPCAFSLALLIGLSIMMGGACGAFGLLLRRTAQAPPLFSAATRTIVRQQMANFDAVHGRGTRLAIMCLLPPICLNPAFWLAGHQGYFALSTRVVQRKIWNVGRLASVAYALLFAGMSIALAVHGGSAETDSRGMMALSISFLVCPLLSTPANRRRVHAAVSRLASTPEEQRAATVAALVGRISSAKVHNLGSERFRMLPFTCLTAGHLGSSGAQGKGGLGDMDLSKLTKHAALGECDAFISHSWHDPADPKWAALRAWADDFENGAGRPPNIWLDKACIDQDNIVESLAALPLFLAGCKRLVVVAGPTYAQRLWCVIEIFTFLYMGGKKERIDVLPIGDGTRAQINERFMAFDAQHAKCFLEEDRERLLGVVEAGFGDYDAFNKLVREALVDRARSSQSKRAWLLQRGHLPAELRHRTWAKNLVGWLPGGNRGTSIADRASFTEMIRKSLGRTEHPGRMRRGEHAAECSSSSARSCPALSPTSMTLATSYVDDGMPPRPSSSCTVGKVTV